MQRWQIRYLGRNSIPRQLSLFEIEQFFNFTSEELQAIRTRRGALNRLGCALQVGFLRMSGRPLNSVRVLSQPLLAHLGQHSRSPFLTLPRCAHCIVANAPCMNTKSLPAIECGWCSAVLALERYGSAARGNPVYAAGVALGQFIRSLYLCDYLAHLDFRAVILKLLNYGESIHTLHRAIYAGPVTSKRGRRSEELVAISGSLSLLANIVMAWNTHRMQHVVDQWKLQYPERIDPAILAHIAPIHHSHINLRGIFQFLFGPYRAALLDRDNTAGTR